MLVLLASSQLKALRTQRAHCRVMPRPLLAVTSPTDPLGFLPVYWLCFPPSFPLSHKQPFSMPSPYLLGKAPLCLSESLQQNVAGR